VTVAFAEAGAGPPVVFLHGLGGTSASWAADLEALSSRYRCIAWDAPGYGDSPPAAAPLTFAALADEVVALLDALGIGRASLVGLSLGGMVAQHTALRHPSRVDRLVLMSTSPRFGLDGTRPDEWRAARLAPLDAGAEPADFAEEVLRGVAGPNISDAALAAQVAAMRRIPAAGLRAMIDCLVTHDTLDRLRDVQAPTLVVVGADDEETPSSYAEAIADRVPGARLAVVPGAGHLLNAEAPDAVRTLLVDFLEDGR
jgi:pimeloyl-ACP methyl ester carboxylesterase